MDTSLEALLAAFDDTAPLERASTIPGGWYTDARVAELERQRVFARSWQLVARAAQLEKPGQYVTSEVAGEPVVVVRGQDGVLRAFFNVCRHHAAAVMTEPEGCAERLRCPYHGWTYALDGLLQSTPELEGICNFERRHNGLVPMAVTMWEKFVFVHVDEHPPPIEEHLGEMAPQIAPLRFDTLHFAGRREWIIECNWKVFVDNYLDGGYHVPYLHRGLNSVLSFRDYTIECGDRFCLQSSPIVDRARGAPPPTPPGSLAPLDGDAVTSAVRKGQAKYYFLHPNLMLNWYEGYLDTNLVIPLGIDRMKVVFEFYFDDVSEAMRARNEQSMEVSARIQDEDHAICESVQRGLRSRAYGAGRLSVRREAGVNLFHKLLAADLRR